MKVEFKRGEMLTALREAKKFDFVIVGGGATGLGAAVDAAFTRIRSIREALWSIAVSWIPGVRSSR